MLFTFPSRYWFAIGLSRVFSLTGWSPLIRAEFLVLRVTQDTAMVGMASRMGLSPSLGAVSTAFRSQYFFQCRSPTTPERPEPLWFGLCPVRSPLLGVSFFYFLFLQLLRCFSSLGLPLTWSDSVSSTRWVVPFGYLGIRDHLHLPRAFRSLSRPSSPVRA